jgi:hypothetical protein
MTVSEVGAGVGLVGVGLGATVLVGLVLVGPGLVGLGLVGLGLVGLGLAVWVVGVLVGRGGRWRRVCTVPAVTCCAAGCAPALVVVWAEATPAKPAPRTPRAQVMRASLRRARGTAGFLVERGWGIEWGSTPIDNASRRSRMRPFCGSLKERLSRT